MDQQPVWIRTQIKKKKKSTNYHLIKMIKKNHIIKQDIDYYIVKKGYLPKIRNDYT